MYIYYNRDQLILPMDLEIFIPKHHLCRIVDLAVEKMDPALFVSLYPGGGRPAYHPKMMLKVILYAYANRIYSSRQIAKQLKENIYFMWLSGHQTPDFRTINRFRSERMKDIIYETFFSIVDLLRQEGGPMPTDIHSFGANQRKSTIRNWRRNSGKSLPRSNR